jgi:Tol biopolymer transport system component
MSESLTGLIVFDHEFDIWTMTADGENRIRLTDHLAEDFDPVWSPDGSMIAFRSHRDGNEEVYVMNVDGSDERNLTANPWSDYSPEWSPDGSRIAFATDRDANSGGNDIYTVNVDGTDPQRLTVAGGIDEYPSWSPDGRLIAYACTGGRRNPDGVGDFEVCVMNADGTDQRQLTDAEGVSDFPAWSPDGSTIAFMTTRGGWPTLPGYVPLGYEVGEFGEYEIYVMDANGENPRNVTNNGREGEQFPAWSPDGSYLVFSRYGCLIVSTPDGSESVQITEGALCSDGFPDWRHSDS